MRDARGSVSDICKGRQTAERTNYSFVPCARSLVPFVSRVGKRKSGVALGSTQLRQGPMTEEQRLADERDKAGLKNL